jgi:NADH:ubiquinone oxidoreductase subunit 3 (subunit A)
MSSQLENLSSQFNTLLTQYTNTYQKYINILNSNENNFITIPETSYIAESNFNVINNTSLDTCQTYCESNSNCSGATFNNNADSCTLSSGSGNFNSTPNSTSIVKQVLYYSNQLQKLNTQLLGINKQMMYTTNNSLSQIQETKQKNQQQEQILNNNYQTLSKERLDIDKMVKQYKTLNAAYENGNINVTSNYYFYIVLLFVSIFLIGLFMKFSLQVSDNNSNVSLIPIIIVILICLFLVFILMKR